jgi:N utilization substance protein B
MITRRLLRIKILQIVFSYNYSGDKTAAIAEKELFHSIKRFYDLYHYLMYLVVELKDFAEEKIQIAKEKKAPTEADLNPNTKFIENQFIQQIESNESLVNYLKSNKLSWRTNRTLVKNLYNAVLNSDLYNKYMSEESRSYNEDKSFVIKLYNQLVVNFEPLYQQLEEQSIYWNDEVDLVISFIVKTLKSFKKQDGERGALLPLYKKDEDLEFAKSLLRKSILHFNEHDDLIEKHSQNWDLDRIAFMDILIMKLAITEILEFPSIPTKVTLDEYIEIAKFYSTEKSNVFINGILDKIINQLREENKIQKQGRGLIGEN